jgi:hypothetical protein
MTARSQTCMKKIKQGLELASWKGVHRGYWRVSIVLTYSEFARKIKSAIRVRIFIRKYCCVSTFIIMRVFLITKR